MMPDQHVKKVRRYVHSFRHDVGIGETDGQTDRQTDRQTGGFAIAISRFACIGMLTRDRNYNSSITAR